MTHSHTPQSLHRPRTTADQPLIQLSDFCYAYDEVTALRHVDLCIYAGDSVVLMGDNGSGKSTLLKALVGLIHPQQGTYRFDGDLVDEHSMRDQIFSKRLHQRVGFIFQDSDAQLFCPSVEDEIAFGPRQMGLPEDGYVRLARHRALAIARTVQPLWRRKEARGHRLRTLHESRRAVP